MFQDPRLLFLRKGSQLLRIHRNRYTLSLPRSKLLRLCKAHQTPVFLCAPVLRAGCINLNHFTPRIKFAGIAHLNCHPNSMRISLQPFKLY